MNIRPVVLDDLWSIMRLYQVEGSTLMPDDLFTDFERLKNAFLASNSYWLMSEVDGQIACLFALLIDNELGLCKLSRIMIDPSLKEIELFVADSLKSLQAHLRSEFPLLEVVYTTTFTLPLTFQKITLKQDFNVMGVFPNANGVDEFNLNGLSVSYLNRKGLECRDLKLRLHETSLPFYNLVKTKLNLPDFQSVDASQHPVKTSKVIYCHQPTLEAIYAPEFVKRRFEILKEKRSQIVNFYPFYWPNCVITDPTGQVEVFLRVIDRSRFAAIIGEHIRIPIDPVVMFNTIFSILRKRNINYVELINDAGDYDGSSLIIESGFTPCGYIPAFKKQGDRRRDYVVYGKAFEFFCKPNLELVPSEYIDFYRQYLKQEQRIYFKGINIEFN